MPTNKAPVIRLSAALIEQAHDFGIEIVWPEKEPVSQSTCLNLNLLQSAAYQPYQNCFGQELYPTLSAKAAYLFVHIATGHIFTNGNKRTAALCLDTFLLVNAHYLILSNQEVETLCESVASFRERGESFHESLRQATDKIGANMVPFKSFRKLNPKVYRSLHRRKNWFINSPVNRIDAPLQQKSFPTFVGAY